MNAATKGKVTTEDLASGLRVFPRIKRASVQERYAMPKYASPS